MQDRISCSDHSVNFRWQITTDIGSRQNKAGHGGLAPDACDPEQRCNWQNEDPSDITQDVDVLVWWRVVGQTRFPLIDVMARQFLTIPAASTTAECV